MFGLLDRQRPDAVHAAERRRDVVEEGQRQLGVDQRVVDEHLAVGSVHDPEQPIVLPVEEVGPVLGVADPEHDLVGGGFAPSR